MLTPTTVTLPTCSSTSKDWVEVFSVVSPTCRQLGTVKRMSTVEAEALSHIHVHVHPAGGIPFAMPGSLLGRKMVASDRCYRKGLRRRSATSVRSSTVAHGCCFTIPVLVAVLFSPPACPRSTLANTPAEPSMAKFEGGGGGMIFSSPA